MDLYPVFCRQMRGLTPVHSLVVAFSGGLDSTVLLALAAQFAKERGINIRAVHIAHGLQDAAKDWPAHCAEVAAALGVACVTEAVQVVLGPRVSLEAAAREARYQALGDAMQPNDILLTGHHLDDQAETLLLALKRGAGIKGLAAMPERKPFGCERKQNQQWRPLLSCSRQSLEAYATEQGLSWIEDPSNSDNNFDRNFLRNRILPTLLAQWPSFNETLSRSAELCAEQLQLAQEWAECDLPALLNEAGGLNIAGLTALSVARRHNVLRHWLQQHNVHPSRAQLHAIWQEVALARPDASPEVRLDASRICRYQGVLYVPQKAGQPIALLQLKAELWQDAGVGRLRLSWVEQEADLIAELDISQLQLSFNISGLRAQPQGRAGSRPLKKLWQEYAVPPWQRSQMPLLLQRENLVAIPGLFVSQAYVPKPDQAGWRIEWEVKPEGKP
ncbi:tRNA lysidine(34) synthetase TilS [Oceanisphaera sp. IT1-181]|uniref:tRNA lysidine(34) synthetase TilS n=1 Tax=Oceanisphaera sp. IT1-181 TaxID=3081199 RepID=UPI0029CAA822|nr:tRNA lysidine(34) synthetase TilS [Oceanisphaera sp. IT1-181]